MRPVFVRPCIPAEVARPPQGEDWIHEPKFDGYRFQIVKNGREVRLFSKSGAEYGARLPRMVEAFGDLPARAAVLDGELVFFDAKGQADFRQLNNQMRTRWPDETQLVFMMFDLLHENGVDLRGVPLSERKRDLNRLCRKADVPFMRQVETFLDGAALFAHSAEFGLEGVVSKRIDQPYVSGPTKYWVKSKSPTWRRDNQQRFRMFEGNKKKPALTEEQKTLIKKREQLARVRERLQDPDLRPGIGRELRKHIAILEREIAELEQG